jgi:hypothetical protein
MYARRSALASTIDPPNNAKRTSLYGVIPRSAPNGPSVPNNGVALLGMTPYNDVRFALLGGSIVDANALLRAYIWHCIAIPLIASIFMALHFWRVRKDGGISGPAPIMLESEIKEEKGHRPVILRPSGVQ